MSAEAKRMPSVQFKNHGIRSHGIQKNVLDSLKNDKFKVIDATCPFVARAQDLAHFLSSEGYPVLILGDKNHPEVIALKSYVDGKVQVVTDYRSLTQQRFKRVGVISQTTQTSWCLPLQSTYWYIRS